MEQIVWLQDSPLGVWIRESAWAIFAALIVHTLGMGFLVGAGLAVDARLLGLGRRIPLPALSGLAPLMAAALAFAAASGAVLVIGYPAKALTNPLFYAKLALVMAALALTWRIDRRVLRAGLAEAPAWSRAAAALSIPLWLAGLTLGRLLAYTHNMLLAY
jgi:hypothetical protein